MYFRRALFAMNYTIVYRVVEKLKVSKYLFTQIENCGCEILCYKKDQKFFYTTAISECISNSACT